MPGSPEVEALKALATNSQWWADWATFVVFIGLLGEIGITFAYTKDKPRSEIVLGVLCGVIIAVGVLGEFRFGARAANANAQLRRMSEGELSSAEDRLKKAEDGLRAALEKAGDAKTSADKASTASGLANESARQASQQAGIAKQQADEIGKEADLLRRQTEKLTQENLAMESRLEKADQELESEKKKRVELAASLLPRDFFDQSGAIGKLSLFPPMTAVFEFTNEHEPTAMAEQINFVLEHCFWKTSRKLVPEGLIGDGISIFIGELDPSNPSDRGSEKLVIAQKTATALQDVLKDSGIDVKIWYRRHSDNPYPSPSLEAFQLPFNILLIRVGPKPNLALETTLKELGPHPKATPLGPPSADQLMGGRRAPIREQGNDLEKNRPQ